MSRRRRGLLLVGLALVLGGLAATDVQRREADIDRRLAPLVDVVVTRVPLPAGKPIRTDALAVRRVPARWAPAGAIPAVGEVAGAEPAIALPAGADVATAVLADPGNGPGAPVRRGERAVQVVAAGSPELIRPGARVDVLVTREQTGTRLALQDVEVLDAAAAPQDPSADGAGERVSATLRVRLADAVFLTDAQATAREIRLLPRASGDRLRARGNGRG